MSDLQCALAEGDTAATARLILQHHIAHRLHQPTRDRLRAIAAHIAPPCPTDVQTVARLVNLATYGVGAP